MARKKHKEVAVESQDDDFNLGIPLTAEQKKKLLLAFLVIIPIILAVFFRAYPATLPITDDWAEQSVVNQYKNQLGQQVASQFPNLPSAQLQAKVDQLYLDALEQNQGQLESQIAATSQEFKKRLQNENDETYLIAIDPWVYYMDAMNIVDHGHIGTELRDGKEFETRTLAPIGMFTSANWHSYMMIITWKFISFFKSNVSLMAGAFWVPLIVASLATIPAFFIARRKAGDLGGFIAASIVAVHSAFLGRTPAGFSDTDAYNVFFPLLITWLFLEAFHAKDLWKKVALAAGAGFALGMYSKIWVGYWYILIILVSVIIGYVGFLIVQKLYSDWSAAQRNKSRSSWKTLVPTLRNTGLLTAVFVGVTGAIISLIYGFMAFISLPLRIFSFSELKNAVNPTLWPNVLTTVAELNEVSFAGVVGSMGGKGLFWFALIGITFALLPTKSALSKKDYVYIGLSVLFTAFLISDTALGFSPFTYLFLLLVPLAVGVLFLLGDKRNIDVKYAFLILIWFVATLYTTTKGVRFTLVLVPALAIGIGTFAGVFYHHAKNILSKELEISKKIIAPVLIILLLFILFAPIKTAHAIALSEVPSMNDAWYDSLTNIRDNSASDAIITSWWDFGHWFKAIAQRPVTFDGGTQNTPMAHWVGKLLLEPNEEKSIAMLRMLDCGSYTGFDRLNIEINNSVRTKKLLDTMLTLSQDEAKELLEQEGLSSQAIAEILALTHCAPPEAFLITSQDMVSKGAVWGHFGSWDFERAYIYNNLRLQPEAQAIEHMVSEYNYTQDVARTLYYETKNLATEQQVNAWVSPWPGYTSSWVGCQKQEAQVNTTALGTNETPTGSLTPRTLVVCPSNLRVSSSAGGDVVIEAVIIDPLLPDKTRFRYGFYQGGTRVQQSDAGQPSVLYFANLNATDGIDRFDFTGAETNNIGVLYDEQNNRVLLADPLHAGSTFTQLFFLDGKYNERYEKFSDKTSFTGQRILVWKVKW